MRSLSLLAFTDDSFWMPPPGSSVAPQVDWIFNVLLGVSTFFFVLIVTLMVVFVFRYRRRPGVVMAAAPSHSTTLEIIWSVIPIAIVAFIFYYGLATYMEIMTQPRNGYDIRVTAQKWNWRFTYPNGHSDGDLHVPVDEPVRLTMSSNDVIHSFYVPDFRVKMDVVPGRYTKTWFCATGVGEHGLYCTAYCGTGHSDMLARVVVQSRADFDKWLSEADKELNNLPPVERGKRLYEKNRCTQCHSIDGTRIRGPSFKGIYGQRVDFEGGTSGTVDDNYIRESILDPGAKIVLGYVNEMPTFKGQLSDDDISALIEFIKSLK